MNEFAPILVSVYHRLYTLEKCINALRANKEAKETILYVVSDGPANDKDAPKILAIRDYLRKIDGFKEVRLILRPENWGASRSCGEAFEEVIARHGAIIRLEDDVIVSRYFLRFMNEGLQRYAAEKKVYAICGYKHFTMPKGYAHDTFFLPRFTPWGYAMWKDRIEMRYSGALGFKDRRIAYDRYHEFQKELPELFMWLAEHDPLILQVLKADSEGVIKAADVRNEYYLQRTGGVCLYPSYTMTNILDSGKDSMHCTMQWHEEDRLADRALRFDDSLEVGVNDVILTYYLRGKYPGLPRRFINSIKRIGVCKTLRYYYQRALRIKDCRGYHE